MLEATTAKDMLTPIVTGAVVGVGTVVTQFLNHRRGKSRDRSGSAVLERIEKKIDDNHDAMRETCRLLAQHIDDVDKTATEALSHAIGPDGKNGLRSRVDELERWQESEAMRERDRLQRIADGLTENRVGPSERRGMDPGDVGSLTPRTA